MRRNVAFILALSAMVLGPVGSLAISGEVAGGQNYCPPGAKFCPAPGAGGSAVVSLDTHFGMDAETGKITAYKGTVHPNEVSNNNLTTTEQVLYVAPPISVENRYVPYPGAPQTNMAATTAYVAQPQYSQPVAQPVAAPQIPQSGQPRNAQARPRREAAQSEVANQQASRREMEREASADKVPWWKGGMWRNDNEKETPTAGEIPWWKGGTWRNRKGGDDKSSGGSAPSKTAAKTTTQSNSQSDDMWDDNDDYADNSFGGASQGNGNYAAQPSGGSYGDPFGGQPQYDPYANPGTANYASDPYTLPNSPGPSSPYLPGYVYPGTDISYESTYQGGYPEQQQYVISSPQEVVDPFAVPQQSYQAPVSEAGGSPQFENAVRMVKENRFSEAKNLLASETSRNPNNAAAWRWLADCHYNLLELNDAIGCYQRALDNDPNDYYALRGQGFSYLHRGHEYWRRMQEEVSMGQKDQAAATFSQAHEDYKKSLDLLGQCLRRAPNDGEAVYGEAMAAEGASRKLYSNVISFLKLGPEHRGRAELFAENCLTVINKGIERSKERANQMRGDTGPRALLAGLYLRKAILYHQLGKNDLALLEVSNSRDVQKSIIDEIDKNNATAIKGIRECEAYWDQWGGNK